MPWYGDQFEYTRGYIKAILEYYFPLREQALHNPGGSAAVVIYDINQALALVKLTKRQAEALLLRMQGLTEFEIGAEFGVSHQAISYRLYGALGKIKKYFVENTCENPAAGANN